MKKILLVLVSLLAIILLAFYGYKAVVLNNMKIKERELDSVWANIYKSCNERSDLLKTLIYPLTLDKFAENHALSLNTSLIDENESSKECTLEFKEKEYVVNSIYLNLLTQNQKGSLIDEKKKNALIKLQNDDTSINNLIL